MRPLEARIDRSYRPPCDSLVPLRQNSIDDVAVNIGETEIAAGESIREPLVIES
jgi:hypothetical protein